MEHVENMPCSSVIFLSIYHFNTHKRAQRIVEFRIPGYPGPSKDQGTEVRIMRGKIFRGKIRM